MPFNTRNPIPSGDLRDLDDNARNIDTWANDKTKLSHPDRFGVERYTWHGLEKKAQLDLADAVAEATSVSEQARDQAIDAKNAAQEAAMMSGFSKYADTLAQLEAGIGTDYVDGDVVMVFQDESRGDTSSIFKIESGAAEFKLTFDKTRQDLLSFTGTISADAEWSDVPAHSDPAFDVQAQALADRVEWSKLHVGSYVVPELFGDTSTPLGATLAMNAAADYCRSTGAILKAGKNAYTVAGDVNLRSVKCDFSGCAITVNDGYLLMIGGNAGTTINPEQVFGIIKKPREWSLNPSDYASASVRVMGAKGQTIRISQVDRIQFYQSTNPATYPSDASQAYSKFFIDFACVIDIDTDPAYAGGIEADGPGSANQWFNENQFFLGRNIAFLMRGSYPHNNNRIHGGCYETANTIIDIQSGNKNWFTDARFEGAASIVFGANTLGNIIDASWFSSTAQMYQRPPSAGSLVDNGRMNIVRDVRTPPTASDCVFLVSSKDTVHDGQPGAYAFREPTRRAIRGAPRTTARLVAESDFIDAQVGDYFFASVESRPGSSSSYILRIYLYDSSMNLIAGNAANLDTSNFTNVFSDRAEGRVNDAAAHHRFGVLNSSTRYVRLEALTSGSAAEDNALRIQVNRVSRVPGRSRETTLINTRVGQFGFVTSTPTKFIGKIGDFLAGSTSDFRCVFMLETSLAAAAPITATQLTLSSSAVSGIGSVQIGDLIGIDLDNGDTHWTTVSAIGGGLHTIAAALPSGAAAGSAVYVSRLAARS